VPGFVHSPPNPATCADRDLSCSNAVGEAQDNQHMGPHMAWGNTSRHARGYGTQWGKQRKAALDRDKYLCQQCLRDGRVTPLCVKPYDHAVDHILPKAKGGTDDHDNLESLCSPCHDAKTATERGTGRARITISPDGWPTGPKRWGYSIPDGVMPSGIPVVLVSGPPAAGKSTYIEANAKDGDTIIDFDLLRKRVGGVKWDTRRDIYRAAFNLRDIEIRALQRKTSGTCYLIVTAPSQDERNAWCEALGNVTVHLLRTPQDVCIARIKSDPNRAEAAHSQIKAVKDWWAVN
jgi:5-methylcytosine-specific restriction enzyme A